MTETPQAPSPEAPEPQAPQGAVRPTPASTPTPPEGYVPQTEVSKIAAREKGEGRQAAINKLLEDTGAESIDQVLAAYTEYQEIQEAVTSEAEKANTAREKAEAKAAAAEQRYTSTLRTFAARDALRDAGINPAKINQGLKLGDLDKLEIDKDGNVSGLEEFVEGVKTEAEEFFGPGATARPTDRAPQVRSGTVEPGAAGSDDPKANMGRSMLSWLTEPVPNDEGPITWP